MMAWFALIIAGLCETFGVSMINQLSIKRNWQTIVLLILSFGSGFALLSYALQYIPMGTGYAIWTGIGVVGSAIVGMLFYGESKDGRRLFYIALVLGAAVGLNLIS